LSKKWLGTKNHHRRVESQRNASIFTLEISLLEKPSRIQVEELIIHETDLEITFGEFIPFPDFLQSIKGRRLGELPHRCGQA
jgi:hypothetical protein